MNSFKGNVCFTNQVYNPELIFEIYTLKSQPSLTGDNGLIYNLILNN